MSQALVLDVECMGIVVDGEIIRPTATVFSLLHSFATGRKGKVWSRNALLDSMNRSLNSSDRAIDDFVKDARKFLKKHTNNTWIVSHYGVGYHWEGTIEIV